MVPQAAGVVGGGDEARAQGVHLGQGADLAGVAEVVGEFAAGEAGAGGGLHGDELVVPLTPELLAHEGGDQAAQVAAAAGAADDDVRHDVVLVQGRLGLQADDGLMQQHLVQHTAQHVPVAGLAGGGLHRLGDGAAQGAGGAGVLLQDRPAHVGGVGGGGGDGGSVGPHDLPPEGLLLVADLHHVHLAVQAQIGAGHGEGGAPLAGAGLCGDALETLVLGVVGLGDGAVELVGAGGIVALKLVVDLGGGLEILLQTVGPHQGRGPVHLVEIPDLLGDGDLLGVVVQLLTDQLVAEHRPQVVEAHGRAGGGVQQRGGLGLHVCPDIVPILGHLVFGEVDLVGDFLECHGACSFLICGPPERRQTKKTFLPQGPIPMVPLGQKSENFCGATQLGEKIRPLGDVPTHVFPW